MYAMFFFFFFNDTATTEIYTLSLHDALPIYLARLDDLVSEVQTQVRSLARQRGKAERYGTIIEERFGIALTDRKSTRLNSSHGYISYAVFCLKKKKMYYHLCDYTRYTRASWS